MHNKINEVAYALFSRIQTHNASSSTYAFIVKVGAIGKRANLEFACLDEDVRDKLLDVCIAHNPENCTIDELIVELHKCAASMGQPISSSGNNMLNVIKNKPLR